MTVENASFIASSTDLPAKTDMNKKSANNANKALAISFALTICD